MSSIDETAAVAPVDVAASEAKVEDLKLDEAGQASEPAALKGDDHGASGEKDETQQPLASSKDLAEDSEKKAGQNSDDVSEQTSPNAVQDATAEQTDEAKKDASSNETEQVSSSEAVQEARDAPSANDQPEEKSSDDSKACDSDSTKLPQEGSTAEQPEVAAQSA